MSVADEKTAPADAVTDMSKAPSQTGEFSDSSGNAKEIDNVPAEDEYPHGLRLFLLASASIMGVFLISLDQVRFVSPAKCCASLTLDRPS